MIKKYLSLALICFLLVTANSSFISAQTQTGKDVSAAAKIKEKIAKRGIGEKKRVAVKKLDGTKLKGYISQASEDSFTLVDAKTKQNVVIDYDDVAKVSNRLTKGDKIALGIVAAGVATVAIVLLSFLSRYCNNEGC